LLALYVVGLVDIDRIITGQITTYTKYLNLEKIWEGQIKVS